MRHAARTGRGLHEAVLFTRLQNYVDCYIQERSEIRALASYPTFEMPVRGVS